MPPNDETTPTPAALHALYLDLKDQVDEVKLELARNTTVTRQVQSNTSDLVDLFNNMRGGFKVLEGLGKAARPLMYIAGFVGSFLGAWAAWKAHR